MRGKFIRHVTILGIAFWQTCNLTTLAQALEFSLGCPTANGDGDYAPSFASLIVSQDAESRFFVGALRWDDSGYHRYLTQERVYLPLPDPMGFEIETHFYNYDNSTSTGFGPAYMLYLVCEPARVLYNLCYGPPSVGWNRCNLPSCYRDTQFLSETNSRGEYSQPNLAFGSYDASGLITGATYQYGARGITGYGNKSLVKLNFQVTRRAIPGVNSVSNQFRCNPNDTPDVPLIGFPERIYAPVCATVTYKHAGVTNRKGFCSP